VAPRVRTARRLVTVSAVAAGMAAPVVIMAEPASAAPSYVEYHSVTGATHQAKFNSLSKRGYRPISLALSGSSNPRYTAVWVKRSGPAYRAFHGYTAGATQKYYDYWTKRDYQPTVMAATGSGSSARYAGIFEKKKGKFFAYGNLTASKFAYYNKYAHSHGYIPISVDAYGTTKAPRYLGVWVANPKKVKWSVSVAKTYAAHDKLFKSRFKKGWRVSDVMVGPGLRYTAIWRTDKIGGWYEYTGMTTKQYVARLKQLKAKGFYPVQVSGGGTGSGVRYAAVWYKN
jgi:Bacterial tandem repeat domain 1